MRKKQKKKEDIYERSKKNIFRCRHGICSFGFGKPGRTVDLSGLVYACSWQWFLESQSASVIASSLIMYGIALPVCAWQMKKVPVCGKSSRPEAEHGDAGGSSGDLYQFDVFG